MSQPSTIVWPFPQEFHVKAEALKPKGVPSMLAMAEYHEALANLASEYKAHGDFSAYIKGQLVCAGDYRKLAEERGE